MTQIATNKEQSARLVACGVDEATADMGRIIGGTDNPNGWQEICNIREAEWWSRTPIEQDGQTIEHIVPTEYAWSLSALLALLPMEIRKDGIDFTMMLKPYPHEEECYRWCASYYDSELEAIAYYSEAPDPIEACVLMAEKLTDNGYKLNNNG